MISQPLAFFWEKGKYRGGMEKALTYLFDYLHNNFPSAIFLQIHLRILWKNIIFSCVCGPVDQTLFLFFLSIFCSNCTCKNWRNIYAISQYSTVARKEKIYILPGILVEIVIVIPINILFEHQDSNLKLGYLCD